jgi:hypothetical protein
MVSEVIREREEPREERWTKTGIQECRDAGFSTAKGERGGHGEVWRRGTTVMRRLGEYTSGSVKLLEIEIFYTINLGRSHTPFDVK